MRFAGALSERDYLVSHEVHFAFSGLYAEKITNKYWTIELLRRKRRE